MSFFSLKAQAVSLAAVAGFLDGYAYLAYKTYVSFMSGNTTLAGLKSGQALFPAVLPAGTAIACFLGGSFAGTWVAASKTAQAHRFLFGAAAVLLALFAALSRHGTPPAVPGIALLSFAMGLVNPALSKIGAEAVSLTFVTGTLNKIGGHLASAARQQVPSDAQGPWDTHGHRARVEAGLWAGFFGGAVLSGVLAPRFEAEALLLPLVVLALFATFSQAKMSGAGAAKLKTLGHGPG